MMVSEFAGAAASRAALLLSSLALRHGFDAVSRGAVPASLCHQAPEGDEGRTGEEGTVDEVTVDEGTVDEGTVDELGGVVGATDHPGAHAVGAATWPRRARACFFTLTLRRSGDSDSEDTNVL
jgi:hypothetical protein